MISKLTLINSILNSLGTMKVKVSICLILLRMTHRANQTVKWLVMINLIILIPFTIAVVIVDLVQYIPLKGYWDKLLDSKCTNADTIGILLKAASGDFQWDTDGLYVCTNPKKAVGVATNFFTAAIPIVIVYRVQAPRQQKWAVYAILMIGFLYALATLATLAL